MPYAYMQAGDYYRGDYYRGDPFIHKKVGGLVRRVAGVAAQFVPGPVGILARKITQQRAPTPSPMVGGPFIQPPPPAFQPSGIPAVPTPGVRGALQRFFPGGASGYESAGCPSGYHLNKSDYFLKDGTFVAKGTACVKNRSQNPANVRALRRAIRRESSFIKVARRTGLVTVPRSKIVRKRARTRKRS